jgi:hypothetical protein
MPSAAADPLGYLHLAWSGGNAIFYSSANAPKAGSPRAWRAPVTITADVPALDPAIALDESTLYVVWTQAGRGLMFATSADRGATWSDPEIIFPAGGESELARWGRIAVDGEGRLHVTLTHSSTDAAETYGRRDPNLLYYLRSDDQGQTWSEPLLMSPEPNFGEMNVATCGRETVHVAWNGRAGRHGRYHRWSADGGRTWSDVDEVVSPNGAFGGGGLTGFPAMVCDGSGALHLVSTGSAGNFYTRWRDGAWLPAVLVSGSLDGSGVNGQQRSLELPSIALSEGNQLHVVFHDGFQRIWHTETTVDAPAVAAVTLPADATEATSIAPQTAPAAATSAPAVRQSAAPVAAAIPPALPAGNAFPIALGVLPAALLVGLIAIFSIARRRG